MRNVGVSLPKVDAKALALGAPVYVDDHPKLPGTLYVKAVRSPHAHAIIRSIDCSIAEKVPGVVAIFTYKDAPSCRFSACGGNYPESSPFDRKILDQKVRYIGDEVALVAAETEDAAAKAAKLVKVQYDILPAVFNAKDSYQGKVVIHDEDDLTVPAMPAGFDPQHNQISTFTINKGNIDEELARSAVIHTASYSTQAQAHAMMETLRAYTYLSPDGRITIIASHQAPYHLRRQVATALGLPIRKIRVIKQRVGGAFGGKKVAIVEPLAAFVTWKTGRPAYLAFTRQENFTATTSRHAMDMDITLGADADGHLRAIKLENFSNTGAYGEEGPAVTMVVANNILPSYNRADAIYYLGHTIYTNTVSGAALRGYGATQGGFVLECAMNELAEKLGMDPCDLRIKNMVRIGDAGGVLHSEVKSCALDQCIARGKEMIGWNEKYPRIVVSKDVVRAVGMAITTHRTSIPIADKATVTIRLEQDGSYLILAGESDLGTGSDTCITQIAAEALSTDTQHIVLQSGDTDYGTYDSGAFASSTTYVAGNAVVKAAEKIIPLIVSQGAAMLDCDVADAVFAGDRVHLRNQPQKFVTLKAIGEKGDGGGTDQILASATYISRQPPLTVMAGFAEIELNVKTGKLKLLRFASVADCGTVINPTLAKVQAEGGIMMGIGLALYEDAHTSDRGRLQTDSFMQYKIPSREDVPADCIELEMAQNSYEPSGPYGAKSIGEASVHVVAPAIAGAMQNAVGIHLRSLPFTPEKIWRAIHSKEEC